MDDWLELHVHHVAALSFVAEHQTRTCQTCARSSVGCNVLKPNPKVFGSTSGTPATTS